MKDIVETAKNKYPIGTRVKCLTNFKIFITNGYFDSYNHNVWFRNNKGGAVKVYDSITNKWAEIVKNQLTDEELLNIDPHTINIERYMIVQKNKVSNLSKFQQWVCKKLNLDIKGGYLYKIELLVLDDILKLHTGDVLLTSNEFKWTVIAVDKMKRICTIVNEYPYGELAYLDLHGKIVIGYNRYRIPGTGQPD